MAAATMNNEQKKRRKRGNVNAPFEVIELFLFRLYVQRRPADAGRRLHRGFGFFSYCWNLTRSCNVSFEHQDGESIALTVCIRDNSA